MQYTSQLARLKASYKPEISTVSYLEEIKNLLENAIRENSLNSNHNIPEPNKIKSELIKSEKIAEPTKSEPNSEPMNIEENLNSSVNSEEENPLNQGLVTDDEEDEENEKNYDNEDESIILSKIVDNLLEDLNIILKSQTLQLDESITDKKFDEIIPSKKLKEIVIEGWSELHINHKKELKQK